jgi:phosphoribosylamine--glycine ligase
LRTVVVGSGGREHALALVLGRTSDEVVVTPGNAGIPGSTATPPEQLDGDLFVIGPEAPLSEGLADRLRAQDKLVFGPGADGAQLEGSKAWMKDLVSAADVPTARYASFTEPDPALEFLRTLPGLYVVKTDYLAAGKGVLVTEDLAEAEDDVRSKLERGGVVIEEGMTGPEASVFAICAGGDAIALEPAQDFKRVADGDQGPNTGGMGAYSPLPWDDADLAGHVLERFVRPTLHELGRRGVDYRGVLYAGLMITPEGPKLVEYNIRFGDPDSQVVLLRLTSDLTALLAEAAAGHVATDAAPTYDGTSAVLVVAAAEGYPAAPRTGDAIAGFDVAREAEGVTVLCAGVAADDAGGLVTAGGRVLDVVGRGPDLAAARERAYGALSSISWPGMHHRSDIAEEAAAGMETPR